MKSLTKQLLPILLIVGCIAVIGWYCPIQEITGIPCPGCGMSTAFYYFVQGRFQEAYFFNPAFYVLLVFAFISGVGWLKNRQFLQSTLWRWLFWLVMLIWFCIWLLRMIYIYPNWPMIYMEDNLLQRFILWMH